MFQPGECCILNHDSRYFREKHGSSRPIVEVEEHLDYHTTWSPPSFLFIARALCEGIPVDGDTYYVKLNGLGEYVHSSELAYVAAQTG